MIKKKVTIGMNLKSILIDEPGQTQKTINGLNLPICYPRLKRQNKGIRSKTVVPKSLRLVFEGAAELQQAK